MGSRWPDALTTVAFFAGATQRLGFITSVLILPLHPVVQLAKAVATLDLLTEGRFELGVGLSIFRQEYDALGVPFGERGAIADEALEAMVELWTSAQPSYSGRFVHFDDVVFDPKPAAGRPSIWVGGDSAAAIRRAARFGGWMPWQTPAEALPERVAALAAAVDAARPGATPRVCVPLAMLQVDAAHRPVEGSGHAVLSSDPLEVLDRLDLLARVGVTDVTVPTPRVGSFGEYLNWLDWFAASVMEPARARRRPGG